MWWEILRVGEVRPIGAVLLLSATRHPFSKSTALISEGSPS